MLSDAALAVQTKARGGAPQLRSPIFRLTHSMEAIGKTRAGMTQALFDSMRSPACITGYMGQYLAANVAFTAALGWSEQELRGFAFYDLAPPAERQHIMKMGAEVIRSGGEQAVYKRPMRRKDGSYLLIEWTVWADPANRLVYAVGQLLGPAQVP